MDVEACVKIRKYTIDITHIKRITNKEIMLDDGRVIGLRRKEIDKLRYAVHNYYHHEIN